MKALFFNLIPQVAKALAPIVMAAAVALAGAVGVEAAPPLGTGEWVATIVTAIVVFLVPNKQTA